MKPVLYILLLLLCLQATATTIDITTLGAKADGKTVNTKAIQKAINQCYPQGGVVLIPTGNFVTGTLYLKSNVTLQFETGAMLTASLDSADYPFNSPQTVQCVSTHNKNGKSKSNPALLYAEGQQNISIIGRGTIYGSGDNPVYLRGNNSPGRPKVILFISCKNVVIEDIFFTTSAFWMQDYLGCDGVKINGIRVLNHINWNDDAIDIDSRNVVISNSWIDSGDDAICLKSYLRDKPCENITITNCVLSTYSYAIKMGTPGRGGFKNITINNIVIDGPAYGKRGAPMTTSPKAFGGISIQCVDGGSVDGISINNVTMNNVNTPFFIRLANRMEHMKAETDESPGKMKNIIISNVVANQFHGRTSSITAFPNNYIENVTMQHCIFNIYTALEKDKVSIAVPENETKYPSTHMYGDALPASGLYVRHVKNIDIKDVQINLLKADTRWPLFLEDVHTASLQFINIKNAKGSTNRISQQDVANINSSNITINNITH